MIIYRPGEKVSVKLGDVSIAISALRPEDKIAIASLVPNGAKSSQSEVVTMAYETLRRAVKGIEAPEYEFSDGRPLSLEHGSDGRLTDESLAVLLQVVDSRKLVQMAVKLAGDGVRDWEIEGVQILEPGKKAPEPESEKKTQA